MATKTKMLITKDSLLAIQQRCVDKLPDDATDRERYLAQYEFENRLRDALKSHKNGMTFAGFADATMDVIEDAGERLDSMLDDARDQHDHNTACNLFEQRAFDAIMQELKADERSDKTAELVADAAKVAGPHRPPPAPPPPLAPAPRPTLQPEPAVVEDRPRITIEVLDRTTVADEPDPEDVARELERAFSKPKRPEPIAAEPVAAADSPYQKYERALTDSWKKQPPPVKPKKRKGARDVADLV